MDTYFFGRTEQLRLLRDNFFVRTPGPGFCGAINGTNDIGKTALVRQAAKEFEESSHPNVFYFATSIVADSSYWGFWADLISRFADDIPEEVLKCAPKATNAAIARILAAYTFFTDDTNLNQMETRAFATRALHHLNFLFNYCTKIGIHILISIDEFDNARTAFPAESGNGAFFQRLFMLSPKGVEYSLSILLISRRRIGTIAHHMADGSDIESAFPPFIVLRGFTNDEMNEYFASYRDIPDLTLSEKQKQDIIYFCGRHPGQLMKMRTLYERYFDASMETSPSDLYREYGEEMQTLYERMNKLLRTEYVDADKQRNCVGTFSQVFVGPTYDTNIKSRIEQLHKYGLLSRWDKSGENIFQLAGLPYDDTTEHHFDYEPMSPYYVEFFKARVLPEEMDMLDRLMTIAEQDVRAGILSVLKSSFPDNWEDILNSFTSSSKQFYRVKLDMIALQNDADTRNITYTNLDVMAYNDYSKIISTYWEKMQPYFRSFKTAVALENAFQYLNDCRNCFAHNNAKILDEQSCSRLRELCSELIKDYELGEKGIPVETSTVTVEKVLAASAVVTPSLQQIQELLDLSEAIVFCYQEKKKPNGNLRGIIKGYGYPAGISKAMLSGFGLNFSPAIGDEFEAKILRWDSNAGMFNLVAP